MITTEELMKIKVLYKQGYSQRAIARELRISRHTVKRYLDSEGYEPKYKRRGKVVSKLDPYKDYLEKRISSADPIHLSVLGIHRWLGT